jgi:glycolate oxidase
LRLIPAVKENLLMLVPFRSEYEACEAVNKIFLAGFTPSALEFMERDALLYVMRFVQSTAIALPDDIMAHLLIEVDGNNKDLLYAEMEAISGIVQQYDVDEILLPTATTKTNVVEPAPQGGRGGKKPFHIQRGRYSCAACRTAPTAGHNKADRK